MNDELQGKLLEWLGKTEDAVEHAIEFGSDQAPDIVNQIIAYNLAISAIWAASGLAMLAIVPISWFMSRSLSPLDKLPARVFGTVIPVIPSALILAHTVPTLVKCLVAPKLFVLEYIANLVK